MYKVQHPHALTAVTTHRSKVVVAVARVLELAPELSKVAEPELIHQAAAR